MPRTPGTMASTAGGLAVPDVLIFGQCLPERRGFGGEQLPAVEGLHDRYADSFRLGAAQECGTFVGGADSVFVAAFEIIGGVEWEHHHVDHAGVENLVRNRRGMGRKADMPDLPIRFSGWNNSEGGQ